MGANLIRAEDSGTPPSSHFGSSHFLLKLLLVHTGEEVSDRGAFLSSVRFLLMVPRDGPRSKSWKGGHRSSGQTPTICEVAASGSAPSGFFEAQFVSRSKEESSTGTSQGGAHIVKGVSPR